MATASSDMGRFHAAVQLGLKFWTCDKSASSLYTRDHADTEGGKMIGLYRVLSVFELLEVWLVATIIWVAGSAQ